MTFASKYEILEPVTSGSVETFVARSLATDERVLVHIFECPEQRPDQPTVQWVLESFQAIASEPTGLVLATGRYSGTTYAYLVTKLPESAVLDAWIRSYQAREEKPAAAPFPGPASPRQPLEKAVEEPLGVTPATALVVSEQAVGARTSPTSRDSDASSTSDDPAAPGHDEAVLPASGPIQTEFEPAKVAQQEPGEFTRQFFSSTANQHDQADQTPLSSPLESLHLDPLIPSTGKVVSPKPAENPPERAVLRHVPAGFRKVMPTATESPTQASAREDLFGSGEASQPQNSFGNIAPEDDRANTGEFTSFFQGPFHGERSAKVPSIPTAWAQPKNEAGEFTKVFGDSGKAPASEEISSPHFAGETSAVRGREEISRLPGSAKPPEAQASLAQNTEILESSRSKSSAFPEPSPYASAPSPASIDPPTPTAAFSSGRPWHDADTAFVFRPKKEAAATSAFATPEVEAAPAQADLPSGPSEFTRIVSGGLRNLESAEEQPAAAGSRDFLEKSSLPSFRAPALPSQFPQAGSFPQTPLPPTGTPALPQSPQLGAAAPKVAATPWMLILILSGLFLVAILLVLYFALKR
jgi:hypothetical protein